ncbi:MAG TPA: N-acetylglucosamine-6-phosphate deacetylase, partial [Gemmataceae bacterium]
SIAAVTDPAAAPADHAADWVAPSFFDIQVNGAHGISFNSDRLTADEVRRVADTCRGHGTGGFCPTLITADTDALAHGFATLARLCESDPELARAIPAFHLEGPYIAAEDGPRGAHPKPHVRPPDWNEFRRWQDAAAGRIRIVTLAPELPGALPFIEKLTAASVVVSIGHTAATPETIRDAVRAGARLSTHLGNGAHAVLPRHPNYVWEQLAADDLWASVIADGHHLPPAVLKSVLRVKTPARTVLISDAGSLAGLPPGQYDCWGQQFEVHPAGKIVVPGTGFLAGAAVFLDACVGHVLNLALADVPAAVAMAAERPRELLGLPVPRIEFGEPADLVAFDWQPGGELRVKAVMKGSTR